MPSGKLAYLTAEASASKRGRVVEKICVYASDMVGHGAIRIFFDLGNQVGVNCECTDFSSPQNFPVELANAVKAGKFRGMGCPKGLLSEMAWERYLDIKYQKVKYFDAIVASAEKEHCEIVASERNYINKICSAYTKVKDIKDAEYIYNITIRNVFWNLFKDIENRSRAWK